MVGSELTARLGDLVPEYEDSVDSEKARALRHANLVQDALEADLIALGEDYLLVSAEIDTEEGKDRYPYPPDYVSMRFVEDITEGREHRLTRLQSISDKNRTASWTGLFPYLLSESSNGQGRPSSYLVGGRFYDLFPTPDGAYTLRLWYSRTLEEITAAGQVQLPDALNNALVYGMAVRERLYRRHTIADLEPLYRSAKKEGLDNLDIRQQDGPRLVKYTGSEGGY